MKVSLLLTTVLLGGCLIAHADVGDGKHAPAPSSHPSYTYPQPPPAYCYPAPTSAYYYGVPVFIGGFFPPFFGGQALAGLIIEIQGRNHARV
jgi:hypothetical protein